MVGGCGCLRALLIWKWTCLTNSSGCVVALLPETFTAGQAETLVTIVFVNGLSGPDNCEDSGVLLGVFVVYCASAGVSLVSVYMHARTGTLRSSTGISLSRTGVVLACSGVLRSSSGILRSCASIVYC